MDMKKILQAVDGAKAKAEVNSSGMRKFLQVVKEGLVDGSGQPVQTGQPGAPASTLSPEQLEYNRLRAQLDSLDALRDTGGRQNVVVARDPALDAKEAQFRDALAKMAGALKTKGIDAAAEYDAPEPGEPVAAPVDLAKKYVDENTGMSRLLSIVTEGRGPLNRPTTAESLTMKHYTSPVLNVSKGATPSMIGKYFKAVEQELKEAAARPNERARQLAERVIERIVPNADGSLPDPSINRLTGKPNPPAAEPAPAPSNVKPGGATVEYGGTTYSVNVFGDGIRPRIGRSDKVVTAKAYVVGDKMYVLLDPTTQESVAGPEKCWPGHRKVGTKPGTGKNAGKRVNDCEKIGEATSAAQQAAIAIAKKKAGKK
jgi:hypothetical protein